MFRQGKYEKCTQKRAENERYVRKLKEKKNDVLNIQILEHGILGSTVAELLLFQSIRIHEGNLDLTLFVWLFSFFFFFFSLIIRFQ